LVNCDDLVFMWNKAETRNGNPLSLEFSVVTRGVDRYSAHAGSGTGTPSWRPLFFLAFHWTPPNPSLPLLGLVPLESFAPFGAMFVSRVLTPGCVNS
jgi:hypothetical protein